MRRSEKPDLKYIVEMNYTKSAAAKRMGVTTATLDAKCKTLFGKKWDEIKAEQRAQKNVELAKKPVGRTSYYGRSQVWSISLK